MAFLNHGMVACRSSGLLFYRQDAVAVTTDRLKTPVYCHTCFPFRKSIVALVTLLSIVWKRNECRRGSASLDGSQTEATWSMPAGRELRNSHVLYDQSSKLCCPSFPKFPPLLPYSSKSAAVFVTRVTVLTFCRNKQVHSQRLFLDTSVHNTPHRMVCCVVEFFF